MNVLQRSIHNIAKAGFSENSAALYDAVRPEYSEEAIAYIKSIPLINDSKKFIELGSGTGKFSHSFIRSLNRDNGLRISYKAVEPSLGFRVEMQKVMADSKVMLENVDLEIVEGTGEKIPEPTNHSIDTVFIAQAFHWMAKEATLAEVHRILYPGKPLVLVWNSLDVSIPWIHALEKDVIDKYYGDTNSSSDIPRYLTGRWRQVFETDFAKSHFSLPITWYGGYQRSKVTRQHIISRILSVSVVAMLDGEAKKKISEEIEMLLRTHPDTRHVVDGQYDLVYKSDVTYTRSIPQKTK